MDGRDEMRVVIEMADVKGYGHIHKSGCRDLRDPEFLGDAATFAEAEEMAEDLTGWGYDSGEYKFAPCAKLAR
jgi:hypothetical protein